MSVFVINPSDSDLVHHGIKGQRWGIRRYQNKDGSLTVLGKRRERSETPLLEGPAETGLSTNVRRSSSSRSKKDDFVEGEWRWADEDVEGTGTSRRSEKKSKTVNAKEGRDYRKADDVVDGKWKSVNEGNKSSKGSSTSNVDKYSSAFSKTSDVTKTLLDYENRMLKKDKTKALKKIDVSTMTDADLKKAISRMSAEDTYKKLKSERIDYGRQKTIKRLETIGSIAATGTSIITLYRKLKNK